MQQTFEDFLISTFAEEEPESMTSKMRWQDIFDNWLSCLDAQQLIAHADRWGDTIHMKAYQEGCQRTHDDYIAMVTKK